MPRFTSFLCLVLPLLAATAQAAPLQVSATNSVLADLVRQVGGNRVQVNVVVPAGADPHTFAPTAGTLKALGNSQVLFANGAGLEPWLPKLMPAVKLPVKSMLPNRNVKLLMVGALPDPHAWWDLRAAAEYSRQIKVTLQALDPAGRRAYENQQNALVENMLGLDAWAKTQFKTVAAPRRLLVTNHDSLNYLARAYGIKVVGVVFPGLSTEREPTARELGQLIQSIKKAGAKVIFTENTVNARLAQTLASETGAAIAPALYTDALGLPGSGGETFLKAFKYNVQTIAAALRAAS